MTSGNKYIFWGYQPGPRIRCLKPKQSSRLKGMVDTFVLGPRPVRFTGEQGLYAPAPKAPCPMVHGYQFMIFCFFYLLVSFCFQVNSIWVIKFGVR